MGSRRVFLFGVAGCVLVGGVAALLAGFEPAGTDVSATDEDRLAASPAVAALAGTARVAATRGVVASNNPGTITAAAFTLAAKTIAEGAPVAEKPVADKEPAMVVASISPEPPLPERPSVQITVTNPLDEAPENMDPVNAVEILDECFVLEVCVDHYLFALYERAVKVDTTKLYEWKTLTFRKKRKLVTVKKRLVRLVEENFGWKDPKAAEKAGMSMMEYVIGGMEPGFKLKLFQALRAADKAGLGPGITSGFRDDYRQSIASGLKAASNRSFHGGSLRGGYGHGLAADVVSINGATKAQKWIATSGLWKWIDDNEKEFGIGRPYLNRDPPHLAPLDGEEYVSRRGSKTQLAKADEKKPIAPAAPKKQEAAKPKSNKPVRTAEAAKPAKPAKPATPARRKTALAQAKR